MWQDPIVEEVREVGAKLADECGYDVHVFAERLRRNQKESNWPIVSREYVKKLKMENIEIVNTDNQTQTILVHIRK